MNEDADYKRHKKMIKENNPTITIDGISPDEMRLIIRTIISYIGDDPNREGLLETPDRVLKSWKELFSGYNQNPEDVFKTFDAAGCDQLILLKEIPFVSCCEHHIMEFSGAAHIAYIPNDRVIGVSKLARLLEIYSRRLQIQERIGEQITNDLMKYLKPKGAACVLECSHTCMISRGIKKQGSKMVTSSLKGCFLNEDSARMELMMRIK